MSDAAKAQSGKSPFAQLVQGLDYPLYIVTTAHAGERSGCLIGFATQCSIFPPRFLACLSKKNHTYQLAQSAGMLAVHVVAGHNKDLAELFGGETGDKIDKFAQIPWREVHGVPILEQCESWFAGRILERVDFGDHVGHVLQPMEAEPSESPEQLTYQQARDIDPGHKP